MYLYFYFTDKQMDNKEVNDPLMNVTLIKGKHLFYLFFYSVNMDRWDLSESLGIVFLFMARTWHSISFCLTTRREEKIMSHTWKRL